MEFFNSLNLKQIKGGTKLKQGDLGSVLSYSLTDENGQEITSFDTKTAYINLVLDDKIWFTTTTLVDISRVTFRIDKAIPIGLYYLEIKIDDYIFPSDRDSIILIEEGSTPYDLKELVPNYDVNMTLKGILSDLSQKGIDISDLNRRIGNANAELIASRNGKPNLKTRIDDLENKTTAQLAEKANKDEVTNVMTPKGNIAYASLPMTGNSVGWYYYCPDGDGTHGAGNYVWNGTSWYFGGTGDEGYNLLKKDIGGLKSDKRFGKNLYDKTKITTGYYIGKNGPIENATLFYSDLIKIEPNEDYCYSVTSGKGGYFSISKYDANKNYLGESGVSVTDFTKDGNRKYVVKNLNATYIRVNTATSLYADNLMVSKGNNYQYEDYYWYWNDDTRKKLEELYGLLNENYTLPYIKNRKLCCNSGGETTAFYAGVDCTEKINAVWANFIFESDGKVDGNATVIINPNGIDHISDITDLSIHCQVTPTFLKVDVLGNKYGSYYYQNLINVTFENRLVCDDSTVNTLIIAITESNNIYVTLNGTKYNGTFTPTDDIASLYDVIGKYVIIEHYTNNKNTKAKMPQFTYVQARDVNNVYQFRDCFDRQNGVLQSAPTGQVYHLINNQNYNR